MSVSGTCISCLTQKFGDVRIANRGRCANKSPRLINLFQNRCNRIVLIRGTRRFTAGFATALTIFRAATARVGRGFAERSSQCAAFFRAAHRKNRDAETDQHQDRCNESFSKQSRVHDDQVYVANSKKFDFRTVIHLTCFICDQSMFPVTRKILGSHRPLHKHCVAVLYCCANLVPNAA